MSAIAVAVARLYAIDRKAMDIAFRGHRQAGLFVAISIEKAKLDQDCVPRPYGEFGTIGGEDDATLLRFQIHAPIR